jgi:hypothetical protein
VGSFVSRRVGGSAHRAEGAVVGRDGGAYLFSVDLDRFDDEGGHAAGSSSPNGLCERV